MDNNVKIYAAKFEGIGKTENLNLLRVFPQRAGIETGMPS